ncbi:uncharacterized protein LOC129740995 [Uranotaenia lowii]|uniref:uncharacterized protein LOC129740995 n=1 Tax=Uranotaenia lowii TaxID=190385 RepID=UPI0024784DD0|nr:uncharacterized protein LOC129740995 [Uranotaenia lowii]
MMTNGKAMMQLAVAVAFTIFLLAQNGHLVAADTNLQSQGECRKLDTCRCEYPDGRGIDLNHIVEKIESYMFTIDPANQDEYFFHPCSDIRFLPPDSGTNDCGAYGYAVCRKRTTNATSTYQRLGTTKDSTFRSSEDGKLYLVYKIDSLTITFQLFCTEGTDKSFIFFESFESKSTDQANNETNILLFSPHACLIRIEEISSSSVGSVLLILFLIGTFTYFTIGSIVRFMYLGARGIEVVPNLEFWKDLPSLVREGVRFVQNGCRVEHTPNSDSYDAI